jgi:SAM-dependent methyltransferase
MSIFKSSNIKFLLKSNSRQPDGNFVGETAKAHNRRLNEGWFEKFAPENLPGIDIGCGIDPLNNSFMLWDQMYGCGDATYMDGVPDNTFNTVYASHVLEHVINPIEAVTNWWRILQPGGNLIINVPHRDLYERKKELPSRYNPDHKTFWLPMESEEPHTLSLANVIGTATGQTNFLLRVLQEEYCNPGEDKHAGGEYSIEAIVQKPFARL